MVGGGASPGSDLTFWRGRRVLVTGHTGFKGGWLCLLLEALGARVTGLALPPAADRPSFFGSVGLGHGMASRFGDIRDAGAVADAFAEGAPEVVFHLAAQALVRRAHAAPVETMSTNVMGTVNILEALRSARGAGAAVFVTSDKVYDNQEWPWPYRENDRLGGIEPYGVSKACCELAVRAWRHSYLAAKSPVAAVATVRAGNVIGGGDWAEDRLIPDAMRAFSAGSPFEVRNPAAIRPWQHVLEPSLGYLLTAEALFGGQDIDSLNFGPPADDMRPVSWVAGRLAELWGGGAAWLAKPAPGIYEANILKLDSSLATSSLGWRPRWPLETSLARTVAWYAACREGEDMRSLSLRQIEEFLA